MSQTTWTKSAKTCPFSGSRWTDRCGGSGRSVLNWHLGLCFSLVHTDLAVSQCNGSVICRSGVTSGGGGLWHFGRGPVRRFLLVRNQTNLVSRKMTEGSGSTMPQLAITEFLQQSLSVICSRNTVAADVRMPSNHKTNSLQQPHRNAIWNGSNPAWKSWFHRKFKLIIHYTCTQGMSHCD